MMEAKSFQTSRLFDLILTVLIRWTFPIGRVYGIPVRIHIFSLVLIFPWFKVIGDYFQIYGIYSRYFAFLILTGSLFVHELMHALVAKYLKKEVAEMLLMLPNAAIVFLDINPRRPSKDIWIYLAGPLSNLIIAGIIVSILKCTFDEYSWMTRQVLKFAGLVNISMALFNMIPFYPLDGGRFFKDLLLILKVRERYANLITLGIASLCFSGLVYIYFSLCSLWKGYYLTLLILVILMIASILSLTGVLEKYMVEDKP